MLRYALTNKARMALFAAGSASGTDFKRVADIVNWEFLDAAAEDGGLSFAAVRDIATLTFGHNVVILTKATAEDRALAARPYRFAPCLAEGP